MLKRTGNDCFHMCFNAKKEKKCEFGWHLEQVWPIVRFFNVHYIMAVTVHNGCATWYISALALLEDVGKAQFKEQVLEKDTDFLAHDDDGSSSEESVEIPSLTAFAPSFIWQNDDETRPAQKYICSRKYQAWASCSLNSQKYYWEYSHQCACSLLLLYFFIIQAPAALFSVCWCGFNYPVAQLASYENKCSLRSYQRVSVAVVEGLRWVYTTTFAKLLNYTFMRLISVLYYVRLINVFYYVIGLCGWLPVVCVLCLFQRCLV